MSQTTDARQQPPRQLMEAMQRMRQDDNAGALELAEAGLATNPADPRERGAYLALAGLAAQRIGRPDRAEPHLRALLAMNPQDNATRTNLANALIELDRPTDARDLVAGSDHPAHLRISGYLAQQAGELEAAADAYRKVTQALPDDLAGWNNLGNVLGQLGDTDAAIEALERAIALAPADLPIYQNLAEILREADRAEARLKVLKDAHALAPEDQDVTVKLGTAYARVDDLDAAIATLREAIARSSGFGEGHIELGMVFESLNRVDDLAALVDSIDLDSAPPEAAFLLAWKARREGRWEEAAELAARIPETIHPMRRFHLIGGIADRVGDADAAFDAFARMNREAVAFAPPPAGPSFREEVENDLALWTDEWAANWVDHIAQDGTRDPIFLVGFPRSGTTLLDTMLMGQSELSVLEERPMMARTSRLFDKRELPILSADKIAELRRAYFDFARESGWDDSKWLVDKHPLNMERVPMIRRLFPNARVILAERHPYDVVFSCFMANFQLNLAMRSFTDLEEAARTYDAVFKAWERGNALFPVDYRPVRYERLVEDARGELAPLVDWLGLEWDDRLLDHTATARERGRVRTASYSQIGEKLYTRASGRWRRYANHLAPVMPILRPWVEKMGYETE
ncbi:MAG: sulfotransferase [Sphingomonadales bacterium]|nr:sulfotransferase [Sphingomonadales bacterium]MBD3773731.1 sulfotransferase [Paracoccaceae bacterium]